MENALARMGWFDGAPDTLWDDQTSAAVAAWYESAGYRPNGLSEEDLSILRAAEDRVRAAEASVSGAGAALTEAKAGPSQSVVIAAEAELGAATRAVDLSRIDADHANQMAESLRSEAALALADAERALVDGETADPPLTSDEVARLESEVADAEAALEDASFQAARTATAQAGLVAQAVSRGLMWQRLRWPTYKKETNTSALAQALGVTREELSGAQIELDDLEARLGVWLPAGEVVFLDQVPVRVSESLQSQGSEIAGDIMMVSGSRLILQASAPGDQSHLLAVGMDVRTEDPLTGGLISGAISVVADRPGTNGVPGDRVYIEVILEDISAELVGENLKLTIPINTTGGEVLVVPSAALFATADGENPHRGRNEDESLRTIRVRTGLAAGGLVEIWRPSGDRAPRWPPGRR